MDIHPSHPLRRHFAGVVEQVFFSQVGMCDPLLTDYLADLLVNFTHIDRLNAIRNAHSKELEQIASILMVVSDVKPASRSERDRVVYRNIGDFTLFWAGLFPELLHRAPGPSDLLLEYVNKGKRSYAIVSELSGEDEAPPRRLFRSLSEDFEYCLYGLGLVRRDFHTTETLPEGGELMY